MTTQTDATTDLSPTPRRPVPLTEDEILSRYGPLIWDALRAFAMDARYLTDIAEVANKLDAWRAKASVAPTQRKPLDPRLRKGACARCGAAFSAQRRVKKYCSKSCADMACHDRKKAARNDAAK